MVWELVNISVDEVIRVVTFPNSVHEETLKIKDTTNSMNS